MPDWLVQFLEDPPPCLTLEGEELVEKNPGKILKVRVAVTFVYLPRDESFGHLKSSDFLVYILKSASQNVIPQLQSALSLQFNQPEFNSFYDVRGLYDGGIKLPTNTLSQLSPIPLFKELFRTDGEQALKFPTPKVIQVEQSAWMTDEEFAREMTAGVNPHIIKRIQLITLPRCKLNLLLEFPPKSKLDSQLYGDNTSTITKQHLEPNFGGLTVEQRSGS